jgi:hypothetical protein
MEIFFQSEEYKKMKTQYEQQCFKLFGKYCKYDGDKITEKSSNEMAEYFKNKKIFVEYVEQQTTKKGTTISTTKELSRSFYQIWSEDPEMREYEEIVFNCNLTKVKPHQFNLFDGFKHFDKTKSQKVDLSLIFEHIKSLVNYNEEHFNYTLNYLAQLVQQPHILPHKTLIFISEEGVGKDIFATFLGEVLSDKYSFNTEKLEQICGRFNTVLGGKLLMVINETNPVESRERVENIKFLITAEKLAIEGKHKDPVKTDNYARFIFFSNRLFAFPVEGQSSRRPVIFKSSSKYLVDNIGIEANDKFFTELVSYYKNPVYQKAFLEFLKIRDISKFNPKDVSKSELHKELEENTVSPIVGYLAGLVNSFPPDESIYRENTTTCMSEFKIYYQNNGFKFDYSQAKFNVELTTNFNVRKIKSGGCMYFEFDMKALKKLLETKYKYVFEDNTDNTIPQQPNPLDGEPDYKQLYLKQQEELFQLKQQMQELKKVMSKAKQQREQTDEELEKELELLMK